MNVAKTKHKKTHKKCAFIGCTNIFYGITNQDFCKDPRCIELRKEQETSIKRIRFKDPDAKNLKLSGPRYKKKFKTGQSIILRCRARNALNIRCPNKFTITYDRQQGVYPCFCEDHRSAYRRQRYNSMKG